MKLPSLSSSWSNLDSRLLFSLSLFLKTQPPILPPLHLLAHQTLLSSGLLQPTQQAGATSSAPPGTVTLATTGGPNQATSAQQQAHQVALATNAANQQVAAAYGINGLNQYHFLAAAQAHQQAQQSAGQNSGASNATLMANGSAATSNAQANQAAANNHALAAAAAAQNAAAAAAHGQTAGSGPMLIPFLQNLNDDVSNLIRNGQLNAASNYSQFISNFKY